MAGMAFISGPRPHTEPASLPQRKAMIGHEPAPSYLSSKTMAMSASAHSSVR
jgi:hypothetical protein